MCQYNCMSRWQTHVSLSIKHILCNIQYIYIYTQYTIYIYTIYNIQYIYIIYIYICIYTSTYSNSRQYVRELVNTCARQCFITLSAKKWVHRFARYKKSRPLDMSRCTWLDLTCFMPELEMVKTIPKWWTNGIGWIPYRPLEATRAWQEDDIGTCGPWAKWILDSQKDGQNGGWIDGLMVA